MKIILGSNSEDKKRILQNALEQLRLQVDVEGVFVESGITDQPLDLETTKQGAINRARNAIRKAPDANGWFGMEAGLHDFGEGFELVTYACFIDESGNQHIGEGVPTPLPLDVSEKVKQGAEFGIEVRKYAEENEIDVNLITRELPFTQAIRNAYAEFLRPQLEMRQGTIGIIMDDTNNFLIVQMVSYGENDWRFPGGGVDDGESAEQAILRELLEELGSDKFEILKKSDYLVEYDWPSFVIAERLIKKGVTHKGQQQTQFFIKFTGDKEEIKYDPEELRQIKWVKYEDLETHFTFAGQWEMAEKTIKEFLA